MEHGEAAHKCSFTISIDVAVEPECFQAPAFRFRFVDGSKKQTPFVGATGWTPVADSPSTQHWDHVISDVHVTEALALALDDDPLLSIFMSDLPPMQPKDPKAKAPPPPTSESPGRSYLGLFELDLSSFLAGNRSVEQTWRSEEPLDPDESPELALLPPNFRSTTTSSSASFAQSLFPAPRGIRALTIRVTVDQPLLSSSLSTRWLPLSITLQSLRDLPGIANPSDPHGPLRVHCKPVYVSFRFFPQQLSTARLVVSSGHRQAAAVSLAFETTFLTARFGRQELLETLSTSAMQIEIHDRDLKQTDRLERLQRKWESLVATGVDITAKETKDPKPMDVFAVDEMARTDWRQLLLRAGEAFAYGTAAFRLHELLNPSKTMVGKRCERNQRSFFTSLKLTADVTASKRRAKPLASTITSANDDDPDVVTDLSAFDKLLRDPGAYAAHNTRLSIWIDLVHAIPASVPLPTPTRRHQSIATPSKPSIFGRMVLIVPYNNQATVAAVNDVLAAVNVQALPGVPLRSYQMTDAEKLACERGDLDVITGFQVLDADLRMIVLEGLASKGMKLAYERLGERKARNDDPSGYRLFANDRLRFTSRLYTAFEIDLKRIKLRFRLPDLMQMPDIYMRTKVSLPCYEALVRLRDMRRVERLADVQEMQLFPSAAMLMEIESKYGESISLEDIYGTDHIPSSHRKRAPRVTHDVDTSDTQLNAIAPEEETPTTPKPLRTSLKPLTDTSNAIYDQLRKQRTTRDFVDERRKESEAMQRAYEAKKQESESTQATPVYMYSNQKLRTQDALEEALRQRLAQDKRATYTYSTEFQSLALSLVNPEALEQTLEAESRKKWTTKRGFVYPAPRKPEEYYRHPDAPSEARCEDLRAPFVDNVNHPKPVSRDLNNPLASTRPAFTTIPSKDIVFGGTNGDGSVNAEYFKSVHLCGEGLRQEMDHARRKEQEDWEKRLVVDRKQLKFLAHGNICSLPRSKPSQLDKMTDILKESPRSKPLRIVRNAKLPSGKKIPLAPPPVSIQNQQEYVGQTFSTMLRPNDPHTFVGSVDPVTSLPRDFRFPSTTELLVPPVKRLTTHKPIAPLRPSERHGLHWSNTPS